MHVHCTGNIFASLSIWMPLVICKLTMNLSCSCKVLGYLWSYAVFQWTTTVPEQLLLPGPHLAVWCSLTGSHWHSKCCYGYYCFWQSLDTNNQLNHVNATLFLKCVFCWCSFTLFAEELCFTLHHISCKRVDEKQSKFKSLSHIRVGPFFLSDFVTVHEGRKNSSVWSAGGLS